jgi:hypothetical protein
MSIVRPLFAAAALVAALPAVAVQPVTTTLTFDEDAVDSSFFVQSVGNFYEGAGALFDDAAFALRNDALGPYFSNAPSALGVLAFDGLAANMVVNAAAGKAFVEQLSFHFASTVDVPLAVSVYAGADGNGQRLARLGLFENVIDSGCIGTAYCYWQKVSIDFAGQAQSLVFSTAGGQIAYDDITISTVPEPTTLALMLAGLGAVGLLARRRA